MARPRVFVSSTYYDLRHIRSSLELFIESVGYEPVLSEKGEIAYLPDAALDESCYREAASADIFVLVVGGRYGAEISAGEPKKRREFFERYDSITRKEYESAYDQDIPIFVLIESGVYAEYRTYLRNKESMEVRYAHVDSINVFRFIEFILSKPRNNPVFAFERSSQIEGWLKDQWSGLFRELLRNRSQQKQLLALTGQIAELKAANETLKNYLEVVLKGIAPDKSSKIIEDEEQRFSDSVKLEQLKANNLYAYFHKRGMNEHAIMDLFSKPSSFTDLIAWFNEHTRPVLKNEDVDADDLLRVLHLPQAIRDYNEGRTILDLRPIELDETSAEAARLRLRAQERERERARERAREREREREQMREQERRGQETSKAHEVSEVDASSDS